MNLKFNIETDCECNTHITDLTHLYEDGYYIPSTKDFFDPSKFIKSESSIVVRIKRVNPISSKEEKLITKMAFMCDSHAKIPSVPDGWYRLEAILLPSKEYISRAPKLWDIDFYYIEENKIFEYNKEGEADVDMTKTSLPDKMFSDLEVLGRGDFEEKYFGVGFITDYVNVCGLWKCYINAINNIFSDLCEGGNICPGRNNMDTNKAYKRDLLKMGLDTINYLTRCGRLEEADHIIEQLTNCNGLCKQSPDMYLDGRKGCNCRPSY